MPTAAELAAIRELTFALRLLDGAEREVAVADAERTAANLRKLMAGLIELRPLAEGIEQVLGSPETTSTTDKETT